MSGKKKKKSDDGADDRRSLLQLQLGSTSLLDLGLPGIWTASFVERGRDAVAVQLASWHNTLSVSVHGIAAQIVFFAWDKSLVLGSVATGITVLGGGTIHFLQRMYQQDLRNALQDAHGRIFGLASKEGFRREENRS